MPFPKTPQQLQFTQNELPSLESISKSRKQEKRRTVRAGILLQSLSGKSDAVIAHEHRISRGTVALCIQKCLQFGVLGALKELPRKGRPRRVPDDAVAWVLNLACQKPTDLGYSYELWTY